VSGTGSVFASSTLEVCFDYSIRRFLSHRSHPFVRWSSGDGHIKKREEERRKKQDPTDTLFVVNYDPQRTRQSDLEDFFKKYGDVRSVRIMKNYAFVQFNTVADATNARENGNGRSLGDRNLSVEYSVAPSRGEEEGRRDRRRRFVALVIASPPAPN
jgi:arginine/serine-rich splicing factor 4/5/6